MDRANKRQRTEEQVAVEPPPGVTFVVSAQGGDGTIHVLTENLGEEHTVGGVESNITFQADRNSLPATVLC